ncbi:phosphoribosyltransferase [Lacibacter luteus]|uniref:Phosphoribosyltransferase n=1 Tax=Lacibacter luteus TaxID=2508719 RepID=A0A4Q1CNH3_9BACT|nr:phosphoribosyltransferase family protein [Lacibacter luteus]RXK62636.1 phosphoribosyltransferase [Lacibacter luteus]
MKYANRKDAGLKLAFQLRKFTMDDCVVCAIPHGAVAVAFEVAASLNFPLQPVLTKKIGHPVNKEYAIGAASLTGYFVWADDAISDDYVKTEVERIQAQLQDMHNKFITGRRTFTLKDKILIIIDDGIATGNTMLAAIQLLRKEEPLKIVVAIPVASSQAYKFLQRDADEVVCLHLAENFTGVGSFYEDFSQVNDADVIAYLDEMEKIYKHSAQTNSL